MLRRAALNLISERRARVLRENEKILIACYYSSYIQDIFDEHKSASGKESADLVERRRYFPLQVIIFERVKK